jgi:nucleotide-binding universal stress UspA family protein
MSVLAELAEPKRATETAFNRILFATDFSGGSEGALAYALALANRHRSELFMVHVLPWEPREFVPLDPLPRELDQKRAAAEQQMKRLVDDAHIKNLHSHTLVERGEVWDVLSDVLEREHIDLLVLGTHGRGGLKKLALGSVAEEVLRLAPCPVLTVGPHVAPIQGAQVDFREILYATDFGTASAKALPYALALAEECRSQLVLLHMVQPMPVADISGAAYGPPAYAARELVKWQKEKRKASEAKLRKLLPGDIELTHEPVYVVGMDFLPEGILDAAKLHKADLIVMGANQVASPHLASHVPWAVTHDVISKAKCPVLTVRN